MPQIRFYAPAGVNYVSLPDGLPHPVVDGYITADSKYAVELLKAGFTPATDDAVLWDQTKGKLRKEGGDVPLPASQSLLSVTTIKLAANTVVATGGYIPFDTVVRDDLGLFISSAQGIKIPADATQFCFSWDIGYLASTDGTYRKITPRLYCSNIAVTNANIGILAHIMLSSNIAQSLGHAFNSHKIDVAGMLLAQSLALAGDQTDRFTLQLGHDATVGSLQVVAGSSMTLEAYTPA